MKPNMKHISEIARDMGLCREAIRYKMKKRGVAGTKIGRFIFLSATEEKLIKAERVFVYR